jgi:adenine phosphoribosyltransferase
MDPRLELIREHIRSVPDFPKPGILFRDITPVLASPPALAATVELLTERYADEHLDHIVAIESRGFIFGAPLALALNKPLHLVRKPGKLPWKTEQLSYTLEYGSNALEIQHDEIQQGGRTLIIDDLLATGGTAAAAAQLVAGQGGQVVEAAFVIELADLGGRSLLGDLSCYAMLRL